MKFYLFWTDSLKIHLCEDCRNDEYEMNIARETSSTRGTRKYLVPVNYKLVISCTYQNVEGYNHFNFRRDRENKIFTWDINAGVPLKLF
jgi:hypothetical protein